MSLFMVCQTSVNESEAPATTFILTRTGWEAALLVSPCLLFLQRRTQRSRRENLARLLRRSGVSQTWLLTFDV